jgi:hypothetical protein
LNPEPVERLPFIVGVLVPLWPFFPVYPVWVLLGKWVLGFGILVPYPRKQIASI